METWFVGRETTLHSESKEWAWSQGLKKVSGEAITFRSSDENVSILLVDSGEVWRFSEKRDEPRIISFENDDSNQKGEKMITKVSSGEGHFLALDKNGKVWSWDDRSGNGSEFGQLGHGNDKKELS